jgi:hypothetical protein
MTTHTLTATVTDTMSASDSDTETINSTASAPLRVVRRSFMGNRFQWGGAVDESPRGPSFSDAVLTGGDDPVPPTAGHECPPDPVTLSLSFKVLIPAYFTGCRIYKAPNRARLDDDRVVGGR